MAHGKKRIALHSEGHSNSDINVTPLIDVVLVLLIIFMVVTPLLEKDIEIRVPDTEKEQQDEQEPPPDQLIVGISADGVIAINMEKISEEDYVPTLKRMVAAKPKGDRLVFFMPDDKANYGKVVAALDGAKQAGAEILGMMTEIPEGMNPNATGEGAPVTGDGTAAPPSAGVTPVTTP